MTYFTETEHDVQGLDNSPMLPEGANLDFLGESLTDHGLDLSKDPGATQSLPPEGAYWAQFSFKSSDELNADHSMVPGISARWKVNATNGDKPQTYLGANSKVKLLRPAIGRNRPGQRELTIEEFDQMGLAGRELNSYLSTRVMFGRTSASDFLKCVLHEVPAGLSAKQLAQTIEEVMQQSPEGVVTLRWVPYYKEEDAQGKPNYKRLAQVNDAMKNKFKKGSAAFPKDDEGQPMTSWKQAVGPDEELEVVVFAEVADLLPLRQED